MIGVISFHLFALQYPRGSGIDWLSNPQATSLRGLLRQFLFLLAKRYSSMLLPVGLRSLLRTALSYCQPSWVLVAVHYSPS